MVIGRDLNPVHEFKARSEQIATLWPEFEIYVSTGKIIPKWGKVWYSTPTNGRMAQPVTWQINAVIGVENHRKPPS